MDIGVVFPQTEIGNDPSAIRDFAQAVESLGYSHLLIFDHVLGADPDRPGGFRGPYTMDTPFHEPFVTFGYLAAVTERIELVTGVIILPQRQTALVAKQTAQIDVLSGGRLRLGVGTGWNAVEYEALNENFHNRGKRQEEQIDVMRKLWGEKSIDYTGKWHRIDNAGINPLPTRQIPVWLGGLHEDVIKRAARIADGWMPNSAPNDDTREKLERLDGYLGEHGRSRADFGIQSMVGYEPGPEKWGQHLEAWRDLGATHVALRTMNAGLATPQAHIDAITRYKEAVS